MLTPPFSFMGTRGLLKESLSVEILSEFDENGKTLTSADKVSEIEEEKDESEEDLN